MKDVVKSEYVEETTLLNKTDAEKKEFYKKHKIIANQEVIEQFFILEPHRSARETYRSERLTTDEDEKSIR
jgi:Fic family protein